MALSQKRLFEQCWFLQGNNSQLTKAGSISTKYNSQRTLNPATKAGAFSIKLAGNTDEQPSNWNKNTEGTAAERCRPLQIYLSRKEGANWEELCNINSGQKKVWKCQSIQHSLQGNASDGSYIVLQHTSLAFFPSNILGSTCSFAHCLLRRAQISWEGNHQRAERRDLARFQKPNSWAHNPSWCKDEMAEVKLPVLLPGMELQQQAEAAF